MTEPTVPEQTLIPEVVEHLNLITKKQEQVVITISFDEINKAIELFRKGKNIMFDPRRMCYYVDGSEVSCQFLTETIEKFSHYINAACAMMKNSKHPTFTSTKNTLKQIDDKLKDVSTEQKNI